MPRLPAPLRPYFPYLQPAYMRTNRALSPLTIRLSQLDGGYVPTGVLQSLEEAAATSGGRCVTARGPETISRPPFRGSPNGLVPLEAPTDTTIGRLAVAELPAGRVLGPSRALITGCNDLVWELSHYFGATHPRQHPVFSAPFPGPPLEFDGRLGVLASRGDGNYYHFLIDVLPRIGVLEQAPDIAPPDRWYVPARFSFQDELLELMAISGDRRIDSDEIPHVRATTLVVPGLPSVVKEKNPPWVVDFLRSRLLTTGAIRSTNPRPIYVVRSAGRNNRAVLNETTLIHSLTERGFDVIDPVEMSVADQISAFASASVIVSAHGAALANLVFATPGAKVVELFPAGLVLPDYWRLAASAGLEYRYLSDWRSRGRRHRSTALVSDISVNVKALEAMLDLLQ